MPKLSVLFWYLLGRKVVDQKYHELKKYHELELREEILNTFQSMYLVTKYGASVHERPCNPLGASLNDVHCISFCAIFNRGLQDI